jgi:hypothetical protein
MARALRIEQPGDLDLHCKLHHAATVVVQTASFSRSFSHATSGAYAP